MKATELMCGDLVMYKDAVWKVHTITAAEQVRLSNPNDLTKLMYMEGVQPIPLTTEILEKNGWKYTNEHTLKGSNTYVKNIDYKGYDYRLTLKFEPSGYFRLDSYDQRYYNLFFTELVNRMSVHELQHALRLCGLNELADNFKI